MATTTYTRPDAIPAGASLAEVMDLHFGGKITREQALDWSNAQQTVTYKCKVGPSGTICVTGVRRQGCAYYVQEWKLMTGAAEAAIAYAESLPRGKDGLPPWSTGKDDHRFDQSKADAKAKYEASKADAKQG